MRLSEQSGRRGRFPDRQLTIRQASHAPLSGSVISSRSQKGFQQWILLHLLLWSSDALQRQ
jgi:hypothetical protein